MPNREELERGFPPKLPHNSLLDEFLAKMCPDMLILASPDDNPYDAIRNVLEPKLSLRENIKQEWNW